MLREPLISFIIPTYNEENHIYQCIDSIVKQSYKKKEIIVIDDGSSDNTVKIVKQFNVKFFSTSHSGPGQARNLGAKIAKGEILVFVDADMICDEKYTINLIRPILQGSTIGTFSTNEKIINNQNTWSNCWNYNLNLPKNTRITNEINSDGLVFRAILKSKFNFADGFEKQEGYYDDQSLYQKTQITAQIVNNAICYHYNPETLSEVYYSARWIGRAPRFPTTFRNILRYSIINSIRVSIWRIRQGAPLQFIIFKIVFDLGMLSGILYKNKKQNYAK